MAIKTKKPPMKETVGAQYLCFDTMNDNNEWVGIFETDVIKLETVKSVKVTENSESTDTYASGKVYDSDTEVSTTDIEIENIAFPDDILARCRGDLVDTGGLILSGGSRVRPYFAYGKVVRLKGEKLRLDWYPKCKLSENSDDTETKEDKASEQTDTIKISAYPFNEAGDIVARVASDVNWPEGLTEDKFFSKPVMSATDLAALVSASTAVASEVADTDTE